MANSPVFLRQATGLVRSLNWADALVMSLAVTGPTYLSYTLQINFVGGVDPGASILNPSLIGLLFMVPLCIMYYLFTITVPRSGGDYVWVSRTLNPGIGFIGGWAMWVAFLALLGGVAVIFASTVVPVFFASLGYSWNIPSWVSLASSISSHPDVVFALALFDLGCGVLITSLGAKFYSWTMIILAAVIGVGTVVSLAYLATTSNATFISDFNNYGGVATSYQGIMTAASANGWTFAPIALGATLVAVPFGVLQWNGFNYSSYAGGEVKSIKKGMLWGIVMALVIDAVANLLGMYWGVNMIGYEFNQASLALSSSGHWPFAVGPWLSFFEPMVIHNSAALFIVQLGWLLAFVWWMGSLLFIASRYVFAFSFDRMLPVAFADISARLRFPLKATALSILIGAIFIYLSTFTTFIGTFLNSTAIFCIIWVVVSIAAIVLPWRRKDIAAAMPGAKWPIPLISIVGFASMIAMGATAYWAFTTPAIGPSTALSDVILATIFIVGGIIFAVRYFYLKGRGMDLMKVAAEIPPE
ncbi:MAG: amino acid permease [Thaumarchaeota archaeon]|nr:amino acid permease [Nitrososphaerota archaeon]